MHHFGKLQQQFRWKLINLCTRFSHGSTNIQLGRIDKILIANRGEIACRVLKTARKMGVKTVAVYSEVDRNSLHVALADEAYCIGPAASSQSYLRQDRIISVAKNSKCQAIHPGYGFLSENADFAELCQKENVIFIGPPASAIRDMGIKNTSKAIMIKAGVPVVEGYHGTDQSNETLLSRAKKIGFPLMIKATRGGGGKGMRIVSSDVDFIEALESARTESEKAFGDSSVLLEKYIDDPRHVEVQVFADVHGNTVHLFERDCSVQRRHQKIIEEAPAPGISQELRSQLGAAAVRAARAVGYVGAGTVEFILNRTDHSFHFMEMNTRLQVEHPITEAITGVDLVEWQLRVANGEVLPLKQDQITHHGHAFEARIYAENPRNDFLPGAGEIRYLRTPKETESVRVETGVREKDEVSVHYDPMIAKLVVWGKNRGEALGILRSSLNGYNIAGLDTNVEFIKDLCGHPEFKKAAVHTGFIKAHRDELFPELRVPREVAIQATVATILLEEMDSLEATLKTVDPFGPFGIETAMRLNHVPSRNFRFIVQNDEVEVRVMYIEPETYLMQVDKTGRWQKVTGIVEKKNDALALRTEIDGTIGKARITKIDGTVYLFTEDREWQFTIPSVRSYFGVGQDQETETRAAVSPMPGLVERILIAKGDSVKTGDSLLVINAMKMEHIVRAPGNGVVQDIFCSIGDNVPKDKLLVKLAAATL